MTMAPKEESLENGFLFARFAVDKAKLCPVDTTVSNPVPRVAIVLERDGHLIGWAAKGHGGERSLDGELVKFSTTSAEHAEKALLDNLTGVDLEGSSAFVTLEPCTKRRAAISCADLLVLRGVKVVYVGNCDPNPDVGALAWLVFHRHGVAVRDFPSDLRNEARRDNYAFFSKFRWSTRQTGGASFDYTANGGERVLGPAGKEFKTRWATMGQGSIYALDYAQNVCIAKNRGSFEDVDDPGRWLEDSHYTKPVAEGEIVIFRNAHGFALVKVLRVTLATGTANAELQFNYQLRYS